MLGEPAFERVPVGIARMARVQFDPPVHRAPRDIGRNLRPARRCVHACIAKKHCDAARTRWRLTVASEMLSSAAISAWLAPSSWESRNARLTATGRPSRRADLTERFDDQRAFLGRGRERFGRVRQRFQPCLFDLLAPPVVIEHTLRDGREQRARFAGVDGFVAREQPQKRVVREVARAMRAAELASQPASQPGVMLDVERLHFVMQDRLVGQHRGAFPGVRMAG